MDKSAFGVFHPCGTATADFATKNSPPYCFLNVAHPLRIRIPLKTEN